MLTQISRLTQLVMGCLQPIEVEECVDSVVNIFAQTGAILPLINRLLREEFLRNAHRSSTLMRSNSIVSKILGSYVRILFCIPSPVSVPLSLCPSVSLSLCLSVSLSLCLSVYLSPRLCSSCSSPLSPLFAQSLGAAFSFLYCLADDSPTLPFSLTPFPGHYGRNYLRSLLSELVTEIVANETLDLEIQPR